MELRKNQPVHLVSTENAHPKIKSLSFLIPFILFISILKSSVSKITTPTQNDILVVGLIF